MTRRTASPKSPQAVGHEGNGLGDLARPVRVRARAVHRHGRRPVRAPAGLRPRRRPEGRRAPRAVRGRRRRDPRRALPALGPDPAGVRPGQPQAGLLPLDGVPDRPVAGEQHHQPDAVAPGRRRRPRQGVEARRAHRAGAGRRPRQRRARPARGLLHRLPGHDGDPGHRVRPPLRLRDLPPGDPRRLPGRTPRPLAEPAGPVGGVAPERDGGRAARLPVRVARGHDLGAPRAGLAPARRAVRPAGGRLRRADDQHPPPLAGRDPGRLRFRRVQRRRLLRRGVGPGPRRDGQPRPLPGRLDAPRPIAAVRPGVLPRRLLPGRHRRPVPPPRERLAGARRTRSPSSSTTPTRRWPWPS